MPFTEVIFWDITDTRNKTKNKSVNTGPHVIDSIKTVPKSNFWDHYTIFGCCINLDIFNVQ